jgi:hypothetical protein
VKSILSLIIIFLFCLFATSFSGAAVHKWVDEKGRTWLTDYPVSKAAKKRAHGTGNAAGQPRTDESAAGANPEGQQAGQQNNSGALFPFPLTEDIIKQLPGFARGDGNTSVSGNMVAMMSGIVIFVVLALYIYISLCLYLIAKKIDVPNPWLAWVPLADLWTFVASAGKEWWWLPIMAALIALSLIPYIGFIFILLNIAAAIYLWICITENVGKNKWLGLLMIVPVVNLIFPAILAFSKHENYPSEMTINQN